MRKSSVLGRHHTHSRRCKLNGHRQTLKQLHETRDRRLIFDGRLETGLGRFGPAQEQRRRVGWRRRRQCENLLSRQSQHSRAL